jgi:hypothetical protein
VEYAFFRDGAPAVTANVNVKSLAVFALKEMLHKRFFLSKYFKGWYRFLIKIALK